MTLEILLDRVRESFSFLLDGDRYRFADSHVSDEFGGANALVVLESDVLILRFTIERGFISLDFQSREDDRSAYSIDLVWRKLKGGGLRSAELDDEYAEFVRDNLDEIEAMFSPPRYAETKRELEDLQRKRAVEMFGPLPEGKED